MSTEKFNGNAVLTELLIYSNASIALTIAGKTVDLKQFLISKKMKFEVHAIRGLFKCLKVISNSLCYGALLKQNEPDIYSSSKKCVKEKFEDGTTEKQQHDI